MIADPREYPLFDALIAQLDIKSDPYTRMEVIPLKHGDAKDVATLLSALISGQNAATQKAATQSVRPGQIADAGPAARPDRAGAGRPSPRRARPRANSAASSRSSPTSGRTRSWSPGTYDDIRLIKGIVEKIDVLLAQVSIQVVIAEVSLSDNDSGRPERAGAHGRHGPERGHLDHGGRRGRSAGSDASDPPQQDHPHGAINPLSFLATLVPNGDLHKVKILQQDTITTTHNKQATFTVSEQQPVITGTTGVPLASVGDQQLLRDLLHRHLQGHRHHAQGDAR